jgi:hypothetical protein
VKNNLKNKQTTNQCAGTEERLYNQHPIKLNRVGIIWSLITASDEKTGLEHCIISVYSTTVQCVLTTTVLCVHYAISDLQEDEECCIMESLTSPDCLDSCSSYCTLSVWHHSVLEATDARDLCK